MSTPREQSDSASTRQPDSRLPPVWGEDTQLVPVAGGHTWLSALACLLFVAALSFLAGPVGALAGIVTAGVWYLLGSPYAFAAGTVLAAPTVPSPVTLLTVTLVGTPLLVLVLAPVATTPYPTGFAAVVLVTTGLLAGGIWLLAEALPIWLLAPTVLGMLGVASYAGHRFLLLQLGLVDDGTDVSTGTDPTTMIDNDS
ncbi:hypothetical protein ACFQJ7_10060 [Halovenus rubra]|uniref:DUF8163 domain-containing protein n=2 Tax=Halovenus rubra TaxID=869890 RepID=A0ABD5X937_9EURY|nr:hypothetical protein [Halovenus rubra]